MQNYEARDLLNKYQAGKATDEEIDLLLHWVQQIEPENQPEFKSSDLDEVTAKIWNKISTANKKRRVIKLSYLSGIAAAIAAIVFGVFFFKAPGKPEPGSGAANYTNDIAPGKNTATLTLANGKTILLSDVKTGVIIDKNSLEYNDGSAVERGDSDLRQDGEPVTITTPRGGTYQVRLPDGSKVWLNAASSLTYTAPLNERGGIRKVELSGEAYFEVFRNKNQPFVVTAKNLTTTVLGTHFNINAYEDEPAIKTTLLEGSVLVAVDGLNKKLSPGFEAVNKGGNIELNKVDVATAVAWKNKQFLFESENIQTIMRMIERWYDVEIIYEGPVTKDNFSGGVSRFDQLSKVLQSLESAGAVHFKIQGRKIYVSQ